MLRKCDFIMKNCRTQGLLLTEARLFYMAPWEWFKDDNTVSQVDLTIFWGSWCHFSWMLTSLCHVIISFPAIDYKVTAVQWIVPGARIWNFLPKGFSGHIHPWISSQECHLNPVAWCWIMRALTFVPRQLLNTDGLWAPKLCADMSRCPGVNWCLSF